MKLAKSLVFAVSSAAAVAVPVEVGLAAPEPPPAPGDTQSCLVEPTLDPAVPSEMTCYPSFGASMQALGYLNASASSDPRTFSTEGPRTASRAVRADSIMSYEFDYYPNQRVLTLTMPTPSCSVGYRYNISGGSFNNEIDGARGVTCARLKHMDYGSCEGDDFFIRTFPRDGSLTFSPEWRNRVGCIVSQPAN